MKDMLPFCIGLSSTVIRFDTMATESCFTHWEGSQICNVVHKVYVYTITGFACHEKFVVFCVEMMANESKLNASESLTFQLHL